jgi:Pentapeptide repeats (8 copies)
MNHAVSALRHQQRAFRGNQSHLNRLIDALQTQSVETWNEWRKGHPNLIPDLRGVNLQGIKLCRIDLRSARLVGANLTGADMWDAQLRETDLRRALLDTAKLNYADLRGANLAFCRLVGADLTLVWAEGASFRGADLSHAILSGARLQSADLSGARVSGISAWEVDTDAKTRQRGLIIDQWVDPLEDIVDYPRASIENIVVRADHIEAAHLLYLVSTKGKFKTVIDAMTERVVLLLGRFGSRRKAVLNAIRHKLADMGYAPVVFDFAAPVDRDLIETVALLAGLSRFVIADLTRPKSTPLESLLIAPQLMIPFASIVQEGDRPFSMFRSLQVKYEWVLPTWTYRNKNQLIRRLKAEVIDPCERMRAKIRRRRQVAAAFWGKTL